MEICGGEQLIELQALVVAVLSVGTVKNPRLVRPHGQNHRFRETPYGTHECVSFRYEISYESS